MKVESCLGEIVAGKPVEVVEDEKTPAEASQTQLQLISCDRRIDFAAVLGSSPFRLIPA